MALHILYGNDSGFTTMFFYNLCCIIGYRMCVLILLLHVPFECFLRFRTVFWIIDHSLLPDLPVTICKILDWVIGYGWAWHWQNKVLINMSSGALCTLYLLYFLNPHKNHEMQGLPCSIHRWGNWDSEMFNDMPLRAASNKLGFKARSA